MHKLNPPDTAPKDGTQILADFGWPYLLVAAWNEVDTQWVCANLQAERHEKGDDYYYENLYENHSSLKCWMRFPENK